MGRSESMGEVTVFLDLISDSWFAMVQKCGEDAQSQAPLPH